MAEDVPTKTVRDGPAVPVCITAYLVLSFFTASESVPTSFQVEKAIEQSAETGVVPKGRASGDFSWPWSFGIL